jgi:ketosteroid isomerase-like protein
MSDLMAVEEAVLAANERFYQAFDSLDVKEMERVWSTEGYVQCIHPGWGPLSGWADVRDSWVRIFNNTSAMHFTPHILHVSVNGDLAWVVCVEAIQSRHGDREQENQVLATNLFEQRDGRWLMIHHHASPIFRVSGEAE